MVKYNQRVGVKGTQIMGGNQRVGVKGTQIMGGSVVEDCGSMVGGSEEGGCVVEDCGSEEGGCVVVGTMAGGSALGMYICIGRGKRTRQYD